MSHQGPVATTARGVADVKNIRGLAFDAYGTLFDVLSVTSLCEHVFPGYGTALAQRWRAKQLQYSLLRSLMQRYRDFWEVTHEGLRYAARSLGLHLTTLKQRQLMEAYLSLAIFPDVRPGLEALKARGLRLAILSNGAPPMLEAVTRCAGIDALLDAIVSADEVRVFKPSPPVYALAASRLQMDPSVVGFVSANSWDICGAVAAGLTAFWIQRDAAEPAEELDLSASGVVTSLTDLAARWGS